MADDSAYAFCERMRAVCVAQIRGDFLGVAASRTDFGDDSIRRLVPAAVVNEHLCACFRECERTGAADAA
jgi:hypothetical protein